MHINQCFFTSHLTEVSDFARNNVVKLRVDLEVVNLIYRSITIFPRMFFYLRPELDGARWMAMLMDVRKRM